jgi:hypothetical protein
VVGIRVCNAYVEFFLDFPKLPLAQQINVVSGDSHVRGRRDFSYPPRSVTGAETQGKHEGQ